MLRDLGTPLLSSAVIGRPLHFNATSIPIHCRGASHLAPGRPTPSTAHPKVPQE